MLEGYQGFVHADAYPGYDRLYLSDGATEVACWAHARHKSWDLRTTHKARCQEILDLVGEGIAEGRV